MSTDVNATLRSALASLAQAYKARHNDPSGHIEDALEELKTLISQIEGGEYPIVRFESKTLTDCTYKVAIETEG